ncbi:ubiquinol-cytochrome C chaperone family protein [Sphingomonas sp.]|uniref:ubiquinol-cytochrome C chaperone family protein n=1 Tax=Sphingomonas sp. TaxID=28214 RepID=UPI002B868F22|nr:ubiquinol-cytochrome C chaperone family protein [Sphingomonas sp.]HTG39268.1 ubiquinol-cytochrome C chaperone family protein [Sphingomonas sp.]
MGLLQRLFGSTPAREGEPLYNALVARARQPHWYQAGGVPDTIDGRFDMVAAVLTMVLLRLEQDAESAATLSASLAECFIDDMDGQLRQQGVGDIMVGKHVGRMMGMLGGRLGAYRDGMTGGDIDGAMIRNIYRGTAPAPDSLAHSRDKLLAFRAALDGVSVERLRAGDLP